MSYFSKDKIKELRSLPIEQVAVALGLEPHRHRVLCFMHDDHHPSLYFNVKANQWRCFACEKGGNVISLVMGYKNMDFLSACRWLADNFNINLDSPSALDQHTQPRNSLSPRRSNQPTHYSPNSNRSQTATISTNQDYAKGVGFKVPRKSYSIDYELFEWIFRVAGLSPKAQHFLYDERLYSKKVVESLGIASITDSKRFANSLIKKFGTKRALKSGLVKSVQTDDFLGSNNLMVCSFVTPCLIFPYRDSQGHIISVQSRYLGGKPDLPRFQFIKGSKVSIFNKPVFNDLAEDEPLYIAEGVTDCLALMSMGHKAIAIPSATLLKPTDASLLAHHNLLMYPDSDRAGEHLYEKLSSLLKPLGTPVTHLTLPVGYKDVSEWYLNTFKPPLQEI